MKITPDRMVCNKYEMGNDFPTEISGTIYFNVDDCELDYELDFHAVTIDYEGFEHDIFFLFDERTITGGIAFDNGTILQEEHLNILENVIKEAMYEIYPKPVFFKSLNKEVKCYKLTGKFISTPIFPVSILSRIKAKLGIAKFFKEDVPASM